MKPPDMQWVFWAGTVGFRRPLAERLEAAAAVDVKRFSVTPLDVEAAAHDGIGAGELGVRIRNAGYDVVMDPIVGWYPGRPHPDSRFGRFSAEESLRMSAQIGAVQLNLIGHHTHDASIDQLAAAFAAMCDRAGDIGADALLEFTPITAIADLATGWDIVRQAARPNGGLLVDTWHLLRGTPDLALLEQIPGERIFSVQVADAPAQRRPDIRDDTLHRALPGDGVLDLVGVLRVLYRIGALRWVGPEVISPEQELLDAPTAAQRAHTRTAEVIARAIALGPDGTAT